MSRRPAFSELAVVIVSLAAGLAAAGCEKKSEPAAPEAGPKPSLTFDGFRARGSSQGVILWEAEAQSAAVYHAKNLAQASRVNISYFQKGRVVSRLKADEADLDIVDHHIAARGNVVLKALNGVVLYTDRLNWNNITQRVTTPSFVKVIRKSTVLTGRGLKADRTLENVEVKENVEIRAKSLADIRQLEKDFAKP
jgi:LPS export ABC transporter protein LptC